MMKPPKISRPRTPKHCLSRAQARSIDDASRFAAITDTAFTHALTIHLKRCGVANSFKFRSDFWKYFGDWYRKRMKAGPSYVWTFESPAAGLHLHASLHVPAHLEPTLQDRVKGWVKRCTGQAPPAGAVHIQKIAKGVSPSDPSYMGQYGSPGTRSGLMGWTGYILKGADAQTGMTMGITTCPQGPYDGKRCGFAQSLGATKRRKIRFVTNAIQLQLGSIRISTTRAFATQAFQLSVQGASQ